MSERIGEVPYTKYGTPAIIVEYKDRKNVLVEFQDEHKYRKYVSYMHFKNGMMKNPYDKSQYNVGYLGVCEHKTKINKIETVSYKEWTHMFRRCYLNSKEHKTYFDCEVCKEWHNFQNFAEWWKNNVYYIKNETMALDKDILKKGNRIYSPETCVIVPQRINSLFIKSNNIRGELPIGVTIQNNVVGEKKYKASFKRGSKSFHIGLFSNPMDAFNAYKYEKEKYIKEVAEEYKDAIPTNLYNAMINYQVDIND